MSDKQKGAVALVEAELQRQRTLFPKAANSWHEGASVLREEFEEFWDIVKLKSKDRDPAKLLEELTQIAAYATRLIIDFDLEAKVKTQEEEKLKIDARKAWSGMLNIGSVWRCRHFGDFTTIISTDAGVTHGLGNDSYQEFVERYEKVSLPSHPDLAKVVNPNVDAVVSWSGPVRPTLADVTVGSVWRYYVPAPFDQYKEVVVHKLGDTCVYHSGGHCHHDDFLARYTKVSP